MTERKEIRDAAIQRLLNNTSAGANVFNSRVNPVSKNQTPAIIVYTDNETWEPISQNPPRFRTELTLSFDCVVFADADWQDTLDTLLDEIQTVLITDPSFVKLIGTFQGSSTTIVFQKEGEKPIAQAVFGLQLEFEKEFQPVVPDNFTGVDVDVDMIEPFEENLAPVGPDGRIDAQISIDP